MPSPPAAPESPESPDAVLVRVWDLPTRVFHWLLVLAVTGAIVTGEVGDPWMAWHYRCGELAGALVLFRLAWGLVGGHWSHFARFPPSPGRAWRHLRGTSPSVAHDAVGHNPLGALSVWAMLVLILAAVGTGLVADDEISLQGPLSHLVGTDATRRATSWHIAWGLDAIFVLLALHVAAIGWYVLRRGEPILRAMWTGDKRLPSDTPASHDSTATRILAVALAAVAAAGFFGAVAHWGD
jgi:cytochrome b